MPFVVKSGSKQFIVSSGSTLVVDRINNKEIGDNVELDLVYAYGESLKSDKVEAKVIAHQKGKKIRVVKYKSKSNYHRQYGYRHYETVLQITTPTAIVEKTAEKVAKKTTTKKTSSTKAEKVETVVEAA